MTHPPNPLPCGCGAKGTLAIGDDRTEWRGVHVVFCPLHAAAPALLAACEAMVAAVEMDLHLFGQQPAKGSALGLAHTAITEAKKGT